MTGIAERIKALKKMRDQAKRDLEKVKKEGRKVERAMEATRREIAKRAETDPEFAAFMEKLGRDFRKRVGKRRKRAASE